MDIEAMGYSVLTSILGIIIVFLSLCALSLLMVALKVAFGERTKIKSNNGSRDKEDSPESQNQSWVMAAVAAFTAVEEAEMRVPSARSWNPAITERGDLWINRWTGTKK